MNPPSGPTSMEMATGITTPINPGPIHAIPTGRETMSSSLRIRMPVHSCLARRSKPINSVARMPMAMAGLISQMHSLPMRVSTRTPMAMDTETTQSARITMTAYCSLELQPRIASVVPTQMVMVTQTPHPTGCRMTAVRMPAQMYFPRILQNGLMTMMMGLETMLIY